MNNVALINENKLAAITVAKRKKWISQILFLLAALAVAALILFPIIWMLPGAFKDRREIFAIPNHFFPKKLDFSNFIDLFNLKTVKFGSSLVMTFIVAVTAVALSLAVNSLAAYAFARLEFRLKNILFGLIMTSMFVPGITILLTSIRVVDTLGMMDKMAVLIIPGIASAYNIFFFRQFFLGLPSTLDEAALIDGSTHWGIYFRIFLPLSVTPSIIIGISVFMGYWNSYLWPTLTIINNKDIMQVMQVMRILNGSEANAFGRVIAAAIIALTVPITLFAFFQKYILEGIAISGIK